MMFRREKRSFFYWARNIAHCEMALVATLFAVPLLAAFVILPEQNDYYGYPAAEHSNVATQIVVGFFRLIHRYRDDISAFSTLGVFVFTCVLAFSTKGLWEETERLAKGSDIQAKQSKRSIELSRKQFEIAQRPWVSVNLTVDEDLRISPIDGGFLVSMGVKLIFENTGNTPALALLYGIEMVGGADGIPATQNKLSASRDFGKHRTEQNRGFALFPGAKQSFTRTISTTIARTPVDEAASEWVKTLAPFLQPAIAGCANYVFPDGGNGETRFSYLLAKDMPSMMGLASVGNAIETTDRVIPKPLVIVHPNAIGNTAR